ncbi:hypothetical protein J3F83DRAFT_698245 [Trichoderma novae-zelandiae]
MTFIAQATRQSRAGAIRPPFSSLRSVQSADLVITAEPRARDWPFLAARSRLARHATSPREPISIARRAASKDWPLASAGATVGWSRGPCRLLHEPAFRHSPLANQRAPRRFLLTAAQPTSAQLCRHRSNLTLSRLSLDRQARGLVMSTLTRSTSMGFRSRHRLASLALSGWHERPADGGFPCELYKYRPSYAVPTPGAATPQSPAYSYFVPLLGICVENEENG